MSNLPSFDTYGSYSSSNDGAHALVFNLPQARVWFSYDTPVAFVDSDGEKFVHENVWSNTTGKHLNAIDGGGSAKKSRVPSDEFERQLAAAFKAA